MKIHDIKVRKILDSRGNATIEVELATSIFPLFRAQIPSGASTGSREAKVFNFSEAHAAVQWIRAQMKGKSFSSLVALDEFLLRLDGSTNKNKIGGNVALGISMAGAKALAYAKKIEVWELLREEFFPEKFVPKTPFLFANLINGGAHATGNLDIQEYMVVVKPQKGIEEAVESIVRFYRQLGKRLGERIQKLLLPIGDEGGYAAPFTANEEPLEILQKQIVEDRFENLGIAIDAAASYFWRGGEYEFGGQALDSAALQKTYLRFLQRIPSLFSIEDPFAEHDRESFQKFATQAKNVWIVGDDLTTTRPDLIQQYADARCINAVIIKPNQVGTITETCRAIKTARERNLKIIVSHRSGETDDHFIVHVAKASNADGVKFGAPVNERAGKYNELLRIYED